MLESVPLNIHLLEYPLKPQIAVYQSVRLIRADTIAIYFKIT